MQSRRHECLITAQYMRWMRVFWVGLLLMSCGASLAQDRPPDARLEFSSTSYGFIVGFTQGHGKLMVGEKHYPFSVSGLKGVTLGFTQISAIGQIYRLRDVADFPGRYYVVEGAFTVGQGGGSALLRNEKGVTLYLQNTQRGAELTLGGGGVDISFMGSITATPTTEKSGKAAQKTIN